LVIRNPFRYGAPVEAAGFCDRVEELAVLTERMRTGVHAFVLSPRRYGKTSLVLQAISHLRAAGGRAGYANLLLCTTEDEVAAVVATAVVREVLRPAGRAKRSLEDVIRHLRVAPRVGVDPAGNISVGFDPVPSGAERWLDVLVDAVELLESAAGDRGAALVLDEFQAVADIGPKGLGGVFKALADQTRSSSLVFAGSHLSVMERLTRSPGAPLLDMGETIRLDVIPAADMVAHLTRVSKQAAKDLPAPVAELIYVTAGPIPNDVQWLAHAAFAATRDDAEIGVEHVEEALRSIVSHQASLFAERYEMLAAVQQRIVRALARGPVEHVYAKAFLDTVRVANANSVRKALGVLTDLEMVQRTGARWRLTSPFFAAWLTSQ
jgi:hypothetical protein